MGDLGKLIVTKGFKNSPKSNKSPDLVTLIGADLRLNSHFRGFHLLSSSGKIHQYGIICLVHIRHVSGLFYSIARLIFVKFSSILRVVIVNNS